METKRKSGANIFGIQFFKNLLRQIQTELDNHETRHGVLYK